jgi:Tol biopolymer transport system component
MPRITWYGLLAVVALAAPLGGRAQAPKPQASQSQLPQAKVRELATIDGDLTGWVRLPSGRALIYTSLSDGATDPNQPRAEDSTFAYDIATKRRTLLGTNMLSWSVSPLGDRLAFSRSSEDGMGVFLWTMPIDPKTAVATGQAQRVSLRSSGTAAFSPDGKMLAFNARRPDGTVDLTLVPATGGSERVVASGRGYAVAWGADGKSLYWEGGQTGGAFERVLVAGGRSESLFPYTKFTGGNVVGLSPDARVAFFLENPDRFSYRTISGIDGEISVALPPLNDGWGFNMTLDSSMRYTTMTQIRNEGVRVFDLATGQARDLLPGNVQSSTPAWSPDGRRLAVLTGNLSHYDITVVNADGSSPRRYPVPVHLDGWGKSPWDMPWSPNGRFLVFRATRALERDKVGYSPDDQSQLALLDVSSGQTRVLATSSERIGRFVWRSDGNAIRATKRTVFPIGSPSQWRIVEIPLNGPERLLRDISTEFPNVNEVVFTSDREAVVRVATGASTERFLVPLDGGAARRLPDPGTEPGSRAGGTLVAGNQLLIPQVDAADSRSLGARVIKVLSTVGDPTRTLRLPFMPASSFAGWSSRSYHIVVLPDGKQVVSVGKVTGESVYKLFLVPLDGSATRLIGELPNRKGVLVPFGDWPLAPSPDGKLLAYTSDGPSTSKIHEIDFGPALQSIMKR